MKIFTPGYFHLPEELLCDTPGVLFMTALSSGAGTTSSTLAMAQVLDSEYNQRVVIIDSSTSQSSLTRQLALQNTVGLWDVVGPSQANPRDISLAKIGKTGISFLPAGKALQNTPMATIDVAQFANLLSYLKETFSMILFDGPVMEPIPATPFPATLFTGAIIVINGSEAGAGTIGKIQSTAQRMNLKIRGVIINRRRYYAPDWVYRLP